MLSKAREWQPIKHVPKIKMSKASGRDTFTDSKTEALLDGLSERVNHGSVLRSRELRSREQIRDFLVIAQDTGMRPMERFSMRIEHIDWENMRMWNPRGKTPKARRFVP
jgi:integrase